ncbi:hypothetical protein [Burkholderia anthina]|uniref:hypothetical protein n=1 Tax=Burkholderia anthina TaxID=179879 RepID=UPI00158BF84D|nr:hypothetical protein [Burkholderia anthina]
MKDQTAPHANNAPGKRRSASLSTRRECNASRHSQMKRIFIYITIFLAQSLSVQAKCYADTDVGNPEGSRVADKRVEFEKIPLTKGSEILVGKLVNLFENPEIILDIDKFSNLLGFTYDHNITSFDENSQNAQIRTDISSKKYSQIKNIEYRMPVEPNTTLGRRVVLFVGINTENVCISHDLINRKFGKGKIFMSSDQWWNGDTSSPWPIGYRFQEAYQSGEHDVANSSVVLTYYPSGCLANFQIQNKLK